MDGRIKNLATLLLCICLSSLMQAQYMSWKLFSDDTLYYATEYMPENVHAASLGPAQIWDFRGLKAPYSLSKRITKIGEKNGVPYGFIQKGNVTEGVVTLKENYAQLTQRIDKNPLCDDQVLTFQMIPPYPINFKGRIGSKDNYSGKRISTFAWPRNINCSWNPPVLPDSCRITYFTLENILVDGDGTLYLPTEVKMVQRHRVSIKETIKVETLSKGKWEDVTSKISNLKRPGSTELRVFVEKETGIPVVTLSLSEDGAVQSAEFKTHHLITRVIEQDLDRPDILAYPNPSYDVVRFQLRDLPFGQYKLIIFNILGVPMKTIEIPVYDQKKTVYVDMSDVKKGTYLYRLENNSGESIRARKFTMITL